MKKLIEVIKHNKSFLILSILYIIIRLPHLTAIPIFNDEAIYLDWGWKATHWPYHLFYSLADAKPPLLMWLFALEGKISPDLLQAGRSVSVLFGYLTMVGIWKIASRIKKEKVAALSALLYIAIPIFSFYDRQALMESAVGTVGVWACYMTIMYWDSKLSNRALPVGIILGIGYLIKTNALLLFVCCVLFMSFDTYRSKRWPHYFESMILIMTGFVLTISSMLLQYDFWRTITTNSRWSLSLRELIGLPWHIWLTNLTGIFVISFIHLTPIIIVLLVVGIILALRSSSRVLHIVLFWLVIPIGLEIIVARSIIERYLVSYLPLTVIFAAISLNRIKNTFRRRLVLISTLGIALSMTALQVFTPVTYLSVVDHISKNALYEYQHEASGYGIPEVVSFIKQETDGQFTYIAMSSHVGNPETGVAVSLTNDSNVFISHIDSNMLPEHGLVDCLTSKYPFLFVSREKNLEGLDKYLEQVYFSKNNVSGAGIGVYRLKENCVGETGILIPK